MFRSKLNNAYKRTVSSMAFGGNSRFFSTAGDYTKLGGHPTLVKAGISNPNVFRNLSTAELYELGIGSNPTDPKTKKTVITSTGALAAYSGVKTGRSPSDKRVVREPSSEGDIWWGSVNVPLEEHSYEINAQRAKDYLNTRPRLYVVDAYAGWDAAYRIKVRIITCRAYHALFMQNMLIMPTEDELQRDFSNGADYTIYNAGEFPSNPLTKGVATTTSVDVNFAQKEMVILGTQYAGEMKKGIFTIMHYIMPQKGVLSLHASANEGETGDVTLLFGLSGTGKTTLSADPKRKLIGDDEHCWSDDGIFNIEGGCYAKCIGLTREAEPEIWDTIKFGAVLENVGFYNEHTRNVNFHDVTLTENTRLSYPLEFIPSAKFPAVGDHPKNIIFLTCDAYGVLPPVAKLNDAQSQYHFISGYTAKVAGTEVGVKDPQSTFSACFGAAFLVFHPGKYAEMLAQKMTEHNANVWLINTGWTGGKHGVGKRMSLTYTRAIIDAIHDGSLATEEYRRFPVFGFDVPTGCEGVPSNVLWPRDTWKIKEDYDKTLTKLAHEFVENFKTYESEVSEEVVAAGPTLSETSAE
eukprot:CAMPEP_0114985554 /NCGR_PEP_ID=MMETSP0216-20121206/7927_1 /TAXON_ID=223996 /ORGANISM="Protocruzia adherens, Strain Boccale" /LENGTH=577 /DNA_ID=CAMNT_0002347875 /DNA_START=29 /DNA_END=1762 /DNA_ORIENTATION=-